MRTSRAFTIIELIATLMVIVILALIALPRISYMRARADQAANFATASVLANATERFETSGYSFTGLTADENGFVPIYAISSQLFAANMLSTTNMTDAQISCKFFPDLNGDPNNPNNVLANAGSGTLVFYPHN